MSIFSRIGAGEIPCYKIAEDENYFAFQSKNASDFKEDLLLWLDGE